MRVNFSLLEEPIEIEKATFLTIKDVQTFAHLVKLIYQYDGENELKLFDAQQKGLKPTELFVVTDILGYDVNSAATLKLIYGDLEAQLNDKPEVKSMIEKLTVTISQLAMNCWNMKWIWKKMASLCRNFSKLLESKSKQRVIRFLKKLWKLHKYIVIYQRKNY